MSFLGCPFHGSSRLSIRAPAVKRRLWLYRMAELALRLISPWSRTSLNALGSVDTFIAPLAALPRLGATAPAMLLGPCSKLRYSSLTSPTSSRRIFGHERSRIGCCAVPPKPSSSSEFVVPRPAVQSRDPTAL